MGLFDKAERNVENHNSGVTNKYDKFGRKIFNIPEKTEAVEEHVTATIIQGKETQKPELSEGASGQDLLFHRRCAHSAGRSDRKRALQSGNPAVYYESLQNPYGPRAAGQLRPTSLR